ncbi:hypothetical protein ACJZ2D_008456 [Fusarium nematophilum]
MKRLHYYFTLIHYVKTSLAARGGHCPPLGPVLPAPVHPSTNPSVEAAIASIQEKLDNITASFNGSGLVIGVKSSHEDDYLLEFAHTPPDRDPAGVQEVDSDSVFRLASLSKLFPVLALLKLNKVNMDDPITKYLPELRALKKQARAQNAIWVVDWDDITIGALASHLAGIPADFVTDIQPFADWTPLGFPPEDPSRNLNCSGLLDLPACTKSVFYKRFGERPPVYEPFSANTVYSNAAYALLGFVIEKVSGMSSEAFIKKTIWKPTGMDHTFASKPDDSLGFIPTGDPWWNATLGFAGPAGAYYSSLNDIHAFGDAILRNELLSPVKTRKWLKPVTSTSSSGILVGESWEIFRSSNVTKDGRLIEFYSKAGDIFTYHSLMVLIPDYDLVVTLLGGGPQISGALLQVLFSDIVKELLPAVEQAGKDENEKVYGGTYSDEATNSTITLSVDDEPGFSITNWTVRGVDIIDTFLSINLPPIFPTPPGLVRLRLYPTTVKTKNQSSWRFVPAAGEPEQTEEAAALFVWPDGMCNTWASMDRIAYQLLAQDHFVFTEEEGAATELELVGYAVKLKRE